MVVQIVAIRYPIWPPRWPSWKSIFVFFSRTTGPIEVKFGMEPQVIIGDMEHLLIGESAMGFVTVMLLAKTKCLDLSPILKVRKQYS